MSVVRRLLHASQQLLPARCSGTIILGYHLVDADTSLPIDISSSMFRRQMLELRTLARTVALHEAVAVLQKGTVEDKTVAVVSFDDAFENFYTKAWPILCELAIPAILFVPVGFVERKTSSPIASAGHLKPVSWRQLEEMVSTGLLTLGSHSWSHPDMRSFPRDEAMAELFRSRYTLEDRLGSTVNSFCYPRGLWSRRAEGYVGEVYDLSTIGGGWKLSPSNLNPLRLWRVPVRRDMNVSTGAILKAPLWLEEWVADKARRFFR